MVETNGAHRGAGTQGWQQLQLVAASYRQNQHNGGTTTYGQLIDESYPPPVPYAANKNAIPWGSAAHAYAELGWKVVPVARHQTGTTVVTVPCQQLGHDPAGCPKRDKGHGGHHAASTTLPESVELWCNIGVATGVKGGLIVFGEDAPGAATRWLKHHGIDPEILDRAPVSHSRSGNRQYWLALPENCGPIPSSVWPGGFELDVIADGKIAMVPPSVVPAEKPKKRRKNSAPGEPHEAGTASTSTQYVSYNWEPGRVLMDDLTMPELPSTIIELIQAAAPAKQNGRGDAHSRAITAPDRGVVATLDRVLDALDRVGAEPYLNSDSWRACCPVHRGDSGNPLSVRVGEKKVLLHCFASCSLDGVLSALGLTSDDLWLEALPTWRPALSNGDEAQVQTQSLSNEGKSTVSGSDDAEADLMRELLTSVGLTDAYLAQHIATRCLADRFVWTRGLGWLAWDGQIWREIDNSIVIDTVRRYFIDLHHAAALAGMVAPLLRGLSGLLSRARITAVTDLCRGVDGIHADIDHFDAHPDLLNCGNGIIDLTTGELRPHDPSLLLTKLTTVNYDPNATHEDWTAALSAIPDDVHEWYQLRLGQSITGYMTPDDVLLIQQGGGENGKTTVMMGVNAALGKHRVLINHQLLLANPGAHTTELMDLRGARMALIEETPEEGRLSTTRVKETVGTPEITARRMRQDPVTFAATHSLFLSTNYLPMIEETDHGTWRRLLLLKFPYTFKKKYEPMWRENDRRGDETLRDRIRAGGEGQHEAALAWLVSGAVRWYQGGKLMPQPPQRIVDDTYTWRVRSDLLLAYVGERLDFDSNRHVRSSDLLVDLNEWLEARGHRKWSDRTLAARFSQHSALTQHHVEKRHTKNTAGLSKRALWNPAASGSEPSSYQAWFGIFFRTETG
jgi:putative DNA primase/helicase